MELALIWIVMAAITAMVAHTKGRSGIGFFFYGLFLWPIALVHALVEPKTEEAKAEDMLRQGRYQCPFCAEWIKIEAKVCPHCQREIPEDGTHQTQSEEGPEPRASTALKNFFAFFVLAMMALGVWVITDAQPQGTTQHAKSPGWTNCEVKFYGRFVQVVVCPPGLTSRDLRTIGELACSRTGPCNAWIWDNESNAPTRPVSFDHPMTDAQLNSAVAVWNNNANELSICARVGC